jgi:hypothetical protein
MKPQDFDRLITSIRESSIEPAAAEAAADRVWSRLSGSGASVADVLRYTTCAEFQSLIPGYLAGVLSDARRFLIEDHTHECVACRKALETARGGFTARRPRPATLVHRPPVLQWALAAMLVAGVAIGAFGGANGLLPGQHFTRATVRSTTGSLYLISDEGSSLLKPGREIRDGDEIRTARASRAFVRLSDGSLLEMGERTDLSLARGWRGTTIHLDRGPLIVQAAKQRLGRLYVSTPDCLVSVKGTVFSVTEGTKGSRVSVIEGAVQVDQGQRESLLHAGDQTTTNESMAQVPIRQDIAWSTDAAKYDALLGELSALGKQIEAIPAASLRYHPDFLDRLPPGTVIYAAIPNLGPTLTQASQILESRLQQSAVLREWWNQQQSSKGPQVQDLMSRLETLTKYLGREVVLSVGETAPGKYRAPVVMATVTKPGLRAFLETQMPLDDRLIYLDDNLIAVSSDAAELQRTVGFINAANPNAFAATPFHARIADSYTNGAGWLLAADIQHAVEQIPTPSVNATLAKGGLSDVRYLTVERRETGGKTDNRATLTFASERTGIASWLAAPGPMGSLDFVSPQASLAVSFVIRNPRSALDQILHMAESGDNQLAANLALFESKTGVNVRNDLAAPLGGEVTFAMDGPLLPMPGWKLVAEVDDPTLLESAIARLVESANHELPPHTGEIILTQRQIDSRTFYTLSLSTYPGIEIDYAFVDSYLVAAPSLGLLQSAIQNREAGNTLTRSAAFRNAMPSDGYDNFSGILYHNIGSALGGIVDQAQALHAMNDQQRKLVESFRQNSAPGLICLYGEPDRIVVASGSGFMGFNLDTLLALKSQGLGEIPNLIQGVMSGSHMTTRVPKP